MTSICYTGKFADIFLHEIHNRAIAALAGDTELALPMVRDKFDEAK